MKSCTVVLSRSLLLVVMAVSWAAAVPLQDTGDIHSLDSETQLQEFLQNNPSLVSDMYPDLLREASEVLVVVEPDVVVELLRRREEEWAGLEEQQKEPQEDEPQEGTQEELEENHLRNKRQATFGFGVNRGPYGRDYSASLGYNRRFNNGRTSVGVNAHRNWGASGRSHGFGISFSHKFRR